MSERLQYGFEYFCGANIVVELEGIPLLEAAGLSYTEQENKVPLYGYSSRHFDAVGDGQVIVRGDLAINYVHNDYLFAAAQMGLSGVGHGLPEFASDMDTNPEFNGGYFSKNELSGILKDEGKASEALESILESDLSEEEKIDMIQRFKSIWTSNDDIQTVINRSANPNDIAGPMNLRVTFGERNVSNYHSGKTGVLLSGLYFLGRGVQTQVDEGVILEIYPFMARRVHTLKPPSIVQRTYDPYGIGDVSNEV